MPRIQNEAYARVKIDDALRASGWDILDPMQVHFEASGDSGRADYILKNQQGAAICVVEAKREDEDPYDAKEQARGYADNCNAQFIILSNGSEHWFWNYRRDDQDAYRIGRFPSLKDLERLSLKNMHPARPLMSEVVGPEYLQGERPDITLRRYQIDAIDTLSKQYDEQQKKQFLLEMATGTGKTLLCAALIRRFLRTQNAERVLFIVDRIDLATQTLEDFGVILHDYSPVLYKTARRRPQDLLGSCVVVATLQSLMHGQRYRDEFTPFHFDLVINDEAHRSIYGDSKEVVHYFQATRAGLTATPKAYLQNINLEELGANNPHALEVRQMRDTYHYFGCEPGHPTYRYDLLDAVQDPEGPFLCLPKIYDLRTDITTQSLEEGGWTVEVNEQEESFKVKDLERKIFTPARNRVMCEAFLERAQKDPSGQIGKSILVAVSQKHATSITQILNELKPGIAVTITSRVKDAQKIAKEFRDGKRAERIAVSVSMLTTGYNCRDLLNVGLMRPIYSPTEYIQIKGRGTRTYTFKIGETEYEKKHFTLLDFCAVCEYFEEEYDYTQPLPLPREEGDPPPGPGPQGPEGPDPEPPEGPDGPLPPAPPEGIPVWTGTDIMVHEEIRIVGPDGEKVDRATFRGSFERDLKQFEEEDDEFKQAIDEEDDEVVETILHERFFNQPTMYYSPEKLVLAYDVPAAAAEFAYKATREKELPTKDNIVKDTVDSISARLNLRYNEQKWVNATAELLAEDPEALNKFMEEDYSIFEHSQFRTLGGLAALAKFDKREEAFEALRQSSYVRQTLSAAKYAAAA